VRGSPPPQRFLEPFHNIIDRPPFESRRAALAMISNGALFLAGACVWLAGARMP
jgi:hypothetical protein